MNKYQKALGYIVDNFLDDIGVIYGKPNNLETECVMVIQELIDKETPKKPVYRQFMRNTPQHEFRESCPNCNNVFDYDELGKKYCGNCGQKLDWGKHE